MSTPESAGKGLTADQLMRLAANAMREQHGPDHERHKMWSALADLLDTQADFIEKGGDFSDIEGGGDAQALAVAAAYLAATTPLSPANGRGDRGEQG